MASKQVSWSVLVNRGRPRVIQLLHFTAAFLVPVKYVALRTCSHCVRRCPAAPSREAALAG